jgi:hypothetical protein
MSETVILITVISSALLSPFLAYLYNSRCHHIKFCCGCMECDRTITDEDSNKFPAPQHQEARTHDDQM